MKITLCTAFRNSSRYLERFIGQITALEDRLNNDGHTLQLMMGEGDSTDDTRKQIVRFFKAKPECRKFISAVHGGPDHGSIVDPDRFQQLQFVGNKIWRAANKLEEGYATIWCESDLIWSTADMLTLLDDLYTYPVVGPLVLLEREGYVADSWYDTWATRINGAHFQHTPPYNDTFAANTNRMFRVDSTGSLLVMRSFVASQVKFDAELIVGMCNQIHQFGHAIHLDTQVKVYHE